jgi:hypothetical protein
MWDWTHDLWIAIVQWAVWSWKRLLVTCVAALSVAALAVALFAPHGSHGTIASGVDITRSPSATAPPVWPILTPAPGVSPTVQAPPTPTLAPEPAVTGPAVSFTRAWVKSNQSQIAWLHGLAPYATPRLMREMQTADPSRVNAHTVTGAGQVITEGDGRVLVAVPTDTYPATLQLVQIGGAWLVDVVDLSTG